LKDRPDTQAMAALRQRSKAQAVELSQVIPEFARRWAEDTQGN
jgi:hypothetical protein